MSTQRAAKPERIAIIEPRCLGLEHVPFNAALVATALAAYPNSEIAAYGDAAHLGALEELLTYTRPRLLARVAWHPLEVPPRKATGWRRAAAVRRLFQHLERAFCEQRPAAVVIATTDPHVLALLKVRLFRSWSGVPALAVFHELLAILGRRRLRSPRWWSLAGALAAPHPRGLRYLVLAGSIRSHLQQIAPHMARHVVAIDHPSLLGDVPHQGPVASPSPLRFGFVGGGRDAKGLREFIELARAVRCRHPEVVFEMVGSAPADVARSELAQLTWSDQKLPLMEFVRRLRGLTHVVWLGDPTHYRLVASGSLADSVAMGVPVICRSGGFVNHLFDSLGEIGIRCETLEQVQREVMRLAGGASLATYPQQRAKVAMAGAALAPEAWAPHLRRALSRGDD